MKEVLKLSTKSELVSATESGHFVQLIHSDMCFESEMGSRRLTKVLQILSD